MNNKVQTDMYAEKTGREIMAPKSQTNTYSDKKLRNLFPLNVCLKHFKFIRFTGK